MNETELKKINDAQRDGALVFVDRENGFPSTELYRAEITAMRIGRNEDCHCISGKYMPKKEVVDRISEAVGIIFTKGETKTATIEDSECGRHTVYIGAAQGKKRMPDGTWRESSICDYEYDPTLRAMLDYDVTELNDETKKKRRSDKDGKAFGVTLGRALLEYRKVATQRANTGARLRVIRELVGMPIAFTGQELTKPLYFSRIVQNTSYILQTPEGRAMATAQALGVDVAALFGRKAALTAGDVPSATGAEETGGGMEHAAGEHTAETAPAAPPAPPSDDDGPPPQGAALPDFEEPYQAKFDRLTLAIRDYLEGYGAELNVTLNSGANPYKSAEAEIQNPGATVETRMDMINRLKTFLLKKGCKV